MTKTILILAIVVLAVGVQSAYAAGCTEEDIQHWNKIMFATTSQTDELVHDTEPDILEGVTSYEVIIQVDPSKAPRVELLVADKLNEIGYTHTDNSPVLTRDIRVIEIEYSSFCNELGFAQVVGGMLLQPDSATLLIAYGIANSIWIVPSVAGIGIAVYLVKRRF